MNTTTRTSEHRRVVPALILVVVLAAAVIFRGELVAWFRGEAVTSGDAIGPTAALGEATVTATLNPDPPRQTGNRLDLLVLDEDEQPVSGAEIEVTYFMPAMGAMPEMRGSADVEETGDGRYEASFDLPMAGTWELIISADLGDGPAEARFGLTVGSQGLTAEADGAGASGDEEIAYYTCSMHPSVKSDEPGQCPICSMDLTPVTKGELESGVLRVDGQRSQKIGVRLAPVQRKALSRSILAVGEVVADENRLTDVNLLTAGWIEKLYVEETGQYVERGQPLFELYSPEILTATEEVLAARRATGPVRDRLVAAAERKLLLLGVTRQQLRRIVARGKARDRITVSSPASGYVVEKNVVEGDRVEEGTSLLRIAGLSEVWVDAQVYEADLPLVAVGQPVTVTLAFVPGRRFTASVDYIHPRLDPKTRTVPVRIVLDNPDLVLRPGMYADVGIEVDLGQRLVIPQEAVLYSGKRRLVFVDLGEGRLQPKEVEVGVRASGLVEIVEGLSEGERVVSSGNFLIAAESRIRSATTIWAEDPEDDDEAAAASTPTFDHDHEAENEEEKRPRRGGDGSREKRSRKPEASTTGRADPEPPVSKAEAPVQYTCPMHPEVVRGAPGQCPICHMDLVEKKKGGVEP